MLNGEESNVITTLSVQDDAFLRCQGLVVVIEEMTSDETTDDDTDTAREEAEADVEWVETVMNSEDW